MDKETYFLLYVAYLSPAAANSACASKRPKRKDSHLLPKQPKGSLWEKEERGKSCHLKGKNTKWCLKKKCFQTK